jgi:hypothetical protein
MYKNGTGSRVKQERAKCLPLWHHRTAAVTGVLLLLLLLLLLRCGLT